MTVSGLEFASSDAAYAGREDRPRPIIGALRGNLIRVLLLGFLVLLVGAGLAGLFWMHPLDAFQNPYSEGFPKLQWFLFVALVGVALLYAFSSALHFYRDYAPSNVHYALAFFVVYYACVMICFVMVTMYFLLYYPRSFANEEIGVGVMATNYLLVTIDAATFSFANYISGVRNFLSESLGLEGLIYEPKRAYEGWIQAFRIAYIFSFAWSLHHFMTFKTLEQREAEREEAIRRKIKKEGPNAAAELAS